MRGPGPEQLRLLPETSDEIRARRDAAARRYKSACRLSTPRRAEILAEYLIACCELELIEEGERDDE
ncbi:MAG: hypothetical protein M3P49_08790 [Actinomycetota bacterium]|nr:hypothetical protein [Actinomycetota bacterium]